MKTVEEKQSELEAYTTVGNKMTVECRENQGTYRTIGEVVDEVYAMSHGYKHLIQRIHQVPEAREDGEEYAYRFGYYALSDKERKVFGQYAPVLSQRELRQLLRLAHEKVWPIFP